VLTVFNETDSSLAISGRDRFVGRYRSTLSSPGLSSSAATMQDCSLAAGDEPCRTSRISASSAACAAHAAAAPRSNSAEPVIANGRTSRSASARARARRPGFPRAGHRAHGKRDRPAGRASMTVTYPGPVPCHPEHRPPRLEPPPDRLPPGQITARVLRISPELARSSSSAASKARAAGHPEGGPGGQQPAGWSGSPAPASPPAAIPGDRPRRTLERFVVAATASVQ
jgi:hypothetical protein